MDSSLCLQRPFAWLLCQCVRSSRFLADGMAKGRYCDRLWLSSITDWQGYLGSGAENDPKIENTSAADRALLPNVQLACRVRLWLGILGRSWGVVGELVASYMHAYAGDWEYAMKFGNLSLMRNLARSHRETSTRCDFLTNGSKEFHLFLQRVETMFAIELRYAECAR